MFSTYTYGVVTRDSIARRESGKGKSKGYAYALFVKFKLPSSADNTIAHINAFKVRMSCMIMFDVIRLYNVQSQR